MTLSKEDIELLAYDMLALSDASDKKLEAKKWTTPVHRAFLRLISDTDMQFHTTWASVMLIADSEGHEVGYELGDILYAATNRLSTPTQTNARLAGLVNTGYLVTPLEAIIDKTLRCGITAESILKACGKVTVFAPALAKDWLKMSQKLKNKLLATGNYVSTPKMDGLRCLIKLNMKNEGAYSRAMKPLKNMKSHVDALKGMIKFPCIVDGEILAASNEWADSISAVKKSGSKIAKIMYIFDCIPAEESESGKYLLTSEERMQLITDNVDYDFRGGSMFAEVIRTPVGTCEEAEEEMRECIGEGWEGTVLHDLTSPYTIKRTNAWLKLKTWLSAEFEVVGFSEGKGRNLGRLGTIHVEGSVDNTAIKAEVGTGFSDAERQEIWNNQDDYIGRTAEIKFFEISEQDSLRFPSFLRWRDDL